jgi:hypothetical protein
MSGNRRKNHWKLMELWLASSLFHLIAKENKFPAKWDQKFEFPLKNQI